MEKKYEIIDKKERLFNPTIYRIKALKNFGDVKKGDLGGWIEKEDNLSQEGNCWVYDEAVVADDAVVLDNARLYDRTEITNNAVVCNDANLYGYAIVYKNAKICGNARISDNVVIADNAVVSGNAHVNGDAKITHDAVVTKDSDYMVFKNTWSSGRYFTYTKSNKMWKVGCFYGTGDELIKKAYKDNGDKGKHYELYVNLIKEQEKLELDNSY